MFLLLDLTLEEVDSANELWFSFHGLAITEPERMHLYFLKFQVALATVIGTHEGHFV